MEKAVVLAAAAGDKMKGFVESMSEKYESLETQKKSLRKLISSAFSEWKGFDEQIGATQNCFRQGLSELESKEKELRSVQDSLSQIVKELDSERDSIKKRVQQVEETEKELKLFSNRTITKLNKERDDFSKEVEVWEANFGEREKTLEDLLQKLEIQRAEIEERKAQIIELNKESEDFLKEIELCKDGVSKGMKEMERRRVEVEEKEAKIMEQKKERDDFLKEIESGKAEISENMKEVERRRVEIEGKEEKVMKREKKVEANKKEMELMIEKQREVELREKDLDSMIEDIVFKEKDVALIRVLNEKRSKELDKREKQLAAKVKDAEMIRDLNEKRSKELDTREKQLGTKVKDVELMRDLNEKRSKELDMREEQLGAKVKDVEGRSKELDTREERLGVKVKDVELMRDMNEGRSKELDMREEQLGAKEKGLENVLERNGVIGMKKIEDHIRRFETEPKEVQLMNIETNEKHTKEPPLQKCKELDVLKKTVDDRIKVAESNHKHPKEEDNLGKNLQRKQVNDEGHHASVEEVAFEESARRQTREENHDCNQLTMKESNLDSQLNDEHHASVKEAAAEEPKERQFQKRIHEESCNDNHLKKKGSHLEKKLFVKEKTPSLVGKGIREEGYDLYKFLQDHGKELNKVVNQVIKTIQQSKEPAKLVLTAVEEFYNRVICGKETEEKKNIAFRSCILLLDQLMNLSVDTHLSSVRNEALKLARLWRSNMKIRDSVEVLGFLYLLASYKLANEFRINLVIRFLEVVAVRRKTRDLCRRLDLKNNIHDLIAELIRKDRILLAFDYVHDLELLDVFPPVSLLKRHVLFSSMEARNICKNKGEGNHESEERALSFEISALKDVIRCIMRRNLQAVYPPDELKERIELLERQRDSLKASSPENQKVDSYGSANTQHDNTNCPSKKEQKKRRHLDSGGGYNTSELPPPSKCPRHVPPLEVNLSEGHRADPYSPRRQQQQQQNNQSPLHVPPPEVHHSEGDRLGNPSSRHPNDTTFHPGPFSPRRQQQQQHKQSPRHVPPPEGHRSGTPSSRHPNDTTFHPDPYSPRWQQQQQQHNQSDPLCHVSDLVSKYLTTGNRESVYPAHQFPYVEQPPSQSVIMAPDQSFYPANPRYI